MANNPVQVEIVGSTPVPVTEVWKDLRGYFADTGKPAVFGLPVARYGAPVGVTAQAVWATDLYDLRPDLATASGFVGNTRAINRDVWLDGPGFYLHGLLTGFTAANQLASLGNLRAYSLEEVATADPRRSVIVGTRTDVTADLFGANATSGAQWFRWRPVGTIRYWRVSFILEYTAAIAFNPVLSFSWSIH